MWISISGFFEDQMRSHCCLTFALHRILCGYVEECCVQSLKTAKFERSLHLQNPALNGSVRSAIFGGGCHISYRCNGSNVERILQCAERDIPANRGGVPVPL